MVSWRFCSWSRYAAIIAFACVWKDPLRSDSVCQNSQIHYSPQFLRIDSCANIWAEIKVPEGIIRLISFYKSVGLSFKLSWSADCLLVTYLVLSLSLVFLDWLRKCGVVLVVFEILRRPLWKRKFTVHLLWLLFDGEVEFMKGWQAGWSIRISHNRCQLRSGHCLGRLYPKGCPTTSECSWRISTKTNFIGGPYWQLLRRRCVNLVVFGRV